MAQHHASHDRLAALNRPPALPDAESQGGSHVDSHDAAGVEAADPAFWGPEPRAVRRSPRGDPEAERADASHVGSPPWWSALVDRVRDLRLEVGVGIVVVVVAALVAGVVWYRFGVAGSDAGPSPTRPPEAASSAAPRAGAPVSTPVPTARAAFDATGAGKRGAIVVVHVAGAVAKPGVIAMPAGARVIDAVEGAGGALADADLDRINLAAELVDGQRILVVKVGATVDPAASGSGGASAGGVAPLVDLNAATAAQLEALPGIGPALANAILAERDRRGGFRSINELRDVRGIGEARFGDLRDLVTV